MMYVINKVGRAALCDQKCSIVQNVEPENMEIKLRINIYSQFYLNFLSLPAVVDYFTWRAAAPPVATNNYF